MSIVFTVILLALLFYQSACSQPGLDTLWTFSYPLSGSQSGISVDQLSDGGYLVSSTSFHDSVGHRVPALLRIDTDRTAVFYREYDTGLESNCVNAVTTTFGHALLLANEERGPRQIRATMVEENGNIVWSTLLGISEEVMHNARSSCLIPSGFVIVGDRNFERGIGAFIVAIDLFGDTLWTRTMGPDGFGISELHDVAYFANGNIVAAGRTREITAPINWDIYLVCLSESGEILWTNVIGGDWDESAFSVDIASDSNIVVAGIEQQNIWEEFVFWGNYDFNGNEQSRRLVEDYTITSVAGVIALSSTQFTLACQQSIILESNAALLEVGIDGSESLVHRLEIDNGFIVESITKCRTGEYLLSGSNADVPSEDRNIVLLRTTVDSRLLAEPVVCIPTNLSLGQNYPNPFNSYTNIPIQGNIPLNTELKIYDVLGREVRSLPLFQSKGGHSTIQFFSRDLPTGIYYYRLTVNWNDVKHMTHVK